MHPASRSVRRRPAGPGTVLLCLWSLGGAAMAAPGAGAMPPARAAELVVFEAASLKDVFATPGYQLTVDLGQQTVTTPDKTHRRFEVDPFRKDCLYRGLDAIGLTLEHEGTITAYETKRKAEAPWLFTDLRS